MRIRLNWPAAKVSADPASFVWAALVGISGGFTARALGLPLPMLLGSVLSVGALALSGARPFGLEPRVPRSLRLFFIPIIGVSIGATFTADLAGELVHWLPSLIALVAFIPAAHAAGYTILRRVGGIDRVTAYYGSVPGGLVEAVMMGEEAGADSGTLVMLQFMRLILCILIVPLGFTLATGHAVGSSAGVAIGAGVTLTPAGWLVLGLSGLVGALLGQRLRLPAAYLTGPLLVSGVVHLAGWVEGAPPGWLVGVTQLVIGISLGGRFAGMAPALFLRAARLSTLNVLAVLALAALAALALAGPVGERWEAVFLAYSPGGLAEMSLVALSLDLSVLYVTAHHVARIVVSVAVARLFARRITERIDGA